MRLNLILMKYKLNNQTLKITFYYFFCFKKNEFTYSVLKIQIHIFLKTMGIPLYFRFLTQKYPNTIIDLDKFQYDLYE